jgi:hypothetical protein
MIDANIHLVALSAYLRRRPRLSIALPRSGVYFVQYGRRIKIGRSADLMVRISEIERSLPGKLDVLLLWPGGLQEELAFHRRFADSRVHGEWFNKSQKLMTFIAQARVAMWGQDIDAYPALDDRVPAMTRRRMETP